MNLTNDESRALTFLAGLLILSAAVRLFGVPEPSEPPAGALDLAAHVEATRAAVDDAARAETPLAPGERLDPNRAPAIELDRLPRIGPALARRIVEDREENGPFRSVDDLARVRGVGDAMVESLREHLDLSRAPPTELLRGTTTARAPRRGLPGGGAASTLEENGTVDLNRAAAAELTTLSGVGPVLAERIVAYRDSAGPFPDVDALAAVKGIGPATLERLRPGLTVRR